MRQIKINGRTYLWKVGRKYILIRYDGPGWAPFSKLVIEKPAPTERWGVIYPSFEFEASMIRIFEDYHCAEDFLLECKGASTFMTETIELVELPPKDVQITPAWIKEKILEYESNSKGNQSGG